MSKSIHRWKRALRINSSSFSKLLSNKRPPRLKLKLYMLKWSETSNNSSSTHRLCSRLEKQVSRRLISKCVTHQRSNSCRWPNKWQSIPSRSSQEASKCPSMTASRWYRLEIKWLSNLRHQRASWFRMVNRWQLSRVMYHLRRISMLMRWTKKTSITIPERASSAVKLQWNLKPLRTVTLTRLSQSSMNLTPQTGN